MYRQVFIPNEQNNNVIIPHRWYGKEVEITIKENSKQTIYRKKLQQQMSYLEIEQILKAINDDDIREIHQIFEPYQFSFRNFKFDRDEANNYD